MRRLLSIVLVFILIFNLTFSAFALSDTAETENQCKQLTHEELMELSAQAFPNHQQAQRNFTRSTPNITATELGAPITSETVKISDTENITYTEYSSGYALYTYEVDWYINSSATGSGYSSVNTDIYVYSAWLTGVLYVRELSYTHVQNGYDVINSVGSVSTNSIQAYIGSRKLNEDANGSAYVYYTGVFENPRLSANVTTVLAVYIGNDSRTYSVF